MVSNVYGMTEAISPENGPWSMVACVGTVVSALNPWPGDPSGLLKLKPSLISSVGYDAEILSNCAVVGREVVANSDEKSAVIFSIPAAAA